MEPLYLKQVDLTPPEGVRSALRHGIKLHEEGHSGDGLVPATVAWARRMANGESATEEKIRKMRAWHARHAVDKRPGWENPPTPGYVAFLLWGGAAGRAWSERKVAELDRSKEKAMSEKADAPKFSVRPAMNLPIVSRGGWDGPAARIRIMDHFGIGGENPNTSEAVKGFLVVDSANLNLRGSYHLPFADIINGKLVAVDSGLRAAASRLPQMNAPQSIKDDARGVLDAYFAKMKPKKSVEVKSFGLNDVQVDESGQFEGYASVFNNVDRHGDVVMPGAFRKTISENPSVPILWQHDQTKPIGVTMAIREDQNGLLVKGELNLDTQMGREAYSLLKQGALKGLSIGYQVIKDDLAGRVRQLKEVKLMEYSLVTFPANERAQVTSIKQLDNDMIMALSEKIAEIHGYAMEAMSMLQALQGEEPGMQMPQEDGMMPECDACGNMHRKEAMYCDMCGMPTRKPKEPRMKADDAMIALLEEMRAALKEG
jgi:HK97 family phage prohead protease